MKVEMNRKDILEAGQRPCVPFVNWLRLGRWGEGAGLLSTYHIVLIFHVDSAVWLLIHQE